MTFTGMIPRPVETCNEFLNSGSQVFVGALPNCSKEPEIGTIGIDGVGIIGDETIELTFTGTIATDYQLRPGYIIPFTEGDVICTGTETISSTASTVSCEPLSFAPAGTETQEIWVAYKLSSLTNIPFDLTKTLVDTTNLDSPQKRDATVARMANSGLSIIATPNDRALWEIVFSAADSSENIYACIFKNSQSTLFGEALVENFTTDGPIDEVERPDFNFKFQGDDYRAVTRWVYAPTEEQTVINDIRKLLGLAVYT